MKYRLLLVFLLPLLLPIMSEAQPKMYDMQFRVDSLDCDAQKFWTSLQIRAHAPQDSFYLGSANFRFSFNRAALANPILLQELGFSGLVAVSPLILYSPQNMNGSIDTIISLNLNLSAGVAQQGQAVDTAWVDIAQLGFDVLDVNACVQLFLHDSTLFPSTIVTEYQDTTPPLDGNGFMFSMQAASFFPLDTCLGIPCAISDEQQMNDDEGDDGDSGADVPILTELDEWKATDVVCQIYPNPAHSLAYLSIQAEEAHKIRVEIRDVQGRLLDVLPSAKATTHHIPLPLDEYAASFLWVWIWKDDHLLGKKRLMKS